MPKPSLLRVLRLAVICEWLLIVGAVASSFYLESSLPPELREYLAAVEEADLAMEGDPLDFAVFIPILTLLVSSVGLLFAKRWARWLYLGSQVALYAYMPDTGPTVEHWFPDTLDGLSAVASGIILAIAFFTSVLDDSEAASNG